MLRIDELWVMQQSVRDMTQVPGMVDYLHSGGLWTLDRITSHAAQKGKKGYPIYISEFPDKEKMIHDGHHRVLAKYFAGQHELHESEYVIHPWTYESYLEVSFDRGFVTPFHPKHECRLNDFWQYKNMVLEMAKEDPEAATEYVWSNKAKYSEPRTIRTVSEFAEQYLRKAA